MRLADAQAALLPNEEDVQFYQEHGWWISPPLLTSEEIDDARFGVERYYSGERDAHLLVELGTDWNESRGNTLRQNDYVSLQVEELRRLVHHPLIAATAATLARTPTVRLFHDQLIYKPPQLAPEQSNVGWHTDIAYWKTCSSRELITAWIAFQDIDEDLAPMQVLDGSHRWDGNDHLEYFHETDHREIEKRISRPGDSLEPVSLLMRRGQVSFHHCRTIHGSRRNVADRPRIALAVHMQDHTNRYVPNTDVKGNRLSHVNDVLCRPDEAGNPDYFDPEICPVLWDGEQ